MALTFCATFHITNWAYN